MTLEKELTEIARGQKMVIYSKQKVSRIYDDEKIITILCETGIPRLVSPMLSFVLDEKGGFDTIANYWGASLNTEPFITKLLQKLI